MSLWQSLLEEYSNAIPEDRRVLVLGDAQDGKRSLLARFKGKDIKDMPEYFGVGYTYVDLPGKFPKIEEDQKVKVELFAVSGPEHVPLLSLCLPNASYLTKTIAIICVDLSKPWAALDTIKKWIDALTAHVDSITRTAEGQKLREEAKAKFAQYLSDFSPQYASLQFVAPNSPRGSPRLAKPSEKAGAPLDGLNASSLAFIGVPLIFVGTKVDLLDRVLSQDATRTPQQATHACNFVQGNIRKLAMKYQAAVCFTSTLSTRPTNCKALLEYIGHRACGFVLPESSKSFVAISMDCFIPAGCDSKEHLAMLPVEKAMPTAYHDGSTTSEITLDVPFDKVIIPELSERIEPGLEVPPVDHVVWLKQKKDLSFDAATTRLSSGAVSPSLMKTRVTHGPGDAAGRGVPTSDKPSEPIERKAEMFFQTMQNQHSKKR